MTSSYKQRKDCNVRKTGKNLRGSDKLIQVQAKLARETLMLRSKSTSSAPTPRERTALGCAFADVAKYADRGRRLEPNIKMTRFRKDTADKVKMKQAAGVWRGWVGDMPKLRLGGAAAIRAQEKLAMGHRAAAWMRGRSRGAVTVATSQASSGSSELRGPNPLLRREETNKHVGPLLDFTKLASTKDAKLIVGAVRKARVVHLGFNADLNASKPLECCLMAWALAIALGQSVKIQNKDLSFPTRAIGYTAAMRTRQHLLFSEDFCKRHGSFVQTCKDIAALKGCSWQVGSTFGSAVGSSIKRSCQAIDCLRDAQRFLKTVKRARVVLPGVYNAHASCM